MNRTDHSATIALLRADARDGTRYDEDVTTMLLASDLLEMHDATGISLDTWASARSFVEGIIGTEIVENGA